MPQPPVELLDPLHALLGDARLSATALPGSSGISILNPDGTEAARIKNPLLSPTQPFDAPANLAFDGKGNVLVTNHAFATGLLLPKQFQVLKVFVDDLGAPLVTPVVP